MNEPSHMPRAARKQAREANRLIKELNEPPRAPGQPEPTSQVAAAPSSETAHPTLRDEPQFVTVGAEQDLSRWKPAAPAAPAQPGVQDPVPAEPTPEAAAAEDINHKFKVLQGKYNAETQRANETIRAQQQTIETLAAQRAAAPAAPAAPAAAPTREQQLANLGVTKEEAESFGPELVDMMARIANATSQPALQQLANEVRGVRQAVGQTVQQVARSAQQLVWDSLSAWEKQAGVSWEVINTSQEFLDWLQGLDIFSGTPRGQGLRQAFDTSDATRVVGIFKAFVEEDARSRSTSRTPRVNRETLLAPGQGRGDAPAAPDGSSGKIWSESEIKDFYSRVQRHRVDPEEKKRIEAEIGAAMKDGRVRPDHVTAHLANVP